MTQYVLLTGSKNNAGDFLIKDRAKDLFSLLKPSVKLIDYDAWEILDESKLKEINNSKALILFLKNFRRRNKMDRFNCIIFRLFIHFKAP